MKEQRLCALSQLERKRYTDVKNNLKSGVTTNDAVQSKEIEDSEKEMLDYLQLKSNDQD